MSKTGRYKVINGEVVKISDKATVHDIWFKKYQISAEKDIRDGFKSFEERGILNQVDDRECYPQGDL